MSAFRRTLRNLNTARVVAVSALLVATFVVEVLFVPERPLTPLYFLAAAVYGAVLLHVVLDRYIGDDDVLAILQIGVDIAIVTGFVVATGGSGSPVSFLFAVPVMIGSALFGVRGGALSAVGAWAAFGLILFRDGWRGQMVGAEIGEGLYAAVSHLVGFVALGLLGGILADRLRAASAELDRKESDLEALRALHADILGSINSGILTADGVGHITFANPAASAILELDAERLVGRSLAEVLDLGPSILRDAEREGQQTRKSRFEKKWRRPSDGAELVLGFALGVLRRGELPAGFLLVFQDLTEIASLEQQVRTRERMAALGEMAAGMAHELRNPLAAISGAVQVLSSDSDAETRSSLVSVTRRETERLNRIIRDFLDFARPGDFRPRPVELFPLVEELVRLLRRSPSLVEGHRIEVVEPKEPLFGHVDPDRMRQVIWNLATNALKAMPEGGLLSIGVWRHGESVVLSFRDEGQGMDEEAVRRYFQPFSGGFKEGTGLGAAIVYRIAEEHGGDVEVISSLGRGTEIRVLLPLAERGVGEGRRASRHFGS